MGQRYNLLDGLVILVITIKITDLLVENEEDLLSIDEVNAAVGDHLYGSTRDITRDAVNKICEKLFHLLNEGYLHELLL